jgi:integrase
MFLSLSQRRSRNWRVPESCPRLRISEALGLQWQDVDYANQRLNLCRALKNLRSLAEWIGVGTSFLDPLVYTAYPSTQKRRA